MNLKLDRTRAFGVICPPEQMTCFDGKSIATAMRDKEEGDPAAYHAFLDNASGRHSFKTRCYEQDGFSYDAEGEIILECLDKLALERAKRAEAMAAANRAALAAHAAAMADAGFADTPSLAEPMLPVRAAVVVTEAGAGALDPAAKLDIPAYFRGEVSGVQWFAVKKQIRDQHGINIMPSTEGKSEKEAARIALIEAGVLPATVA